MDKNKLNFLKNIGWDGALVALIASTLFVILLIPTIIMPVVWIALIVLCSLKFFSPEKQGVGEESKILQGAHKKLENGLDSGIFCLGKSLDKNREVWLDQQALCTHTLVIGEDSTRKKMLMMNCAASALGSGSGFCWIDGSGDISLYAWLRTLTRRFDRDEDFIFLNFMNGNSGNNRDQEQVASMTFNPFIKGSSSSLSNLLGNIIFDHTASPNTDGAMWQGRTMMLVESLLRILCWLRDNKELQLNIAVFRDHSGLKKLIGLVDPEIYPDMPKSISAGLTSYLGSLPGFQWEKGWKQSQTTLDQHGWCEMTLMKYAGAMADVYGHIFLSNSPDVDFDDIIMNRRILVVLLPSLESSTDETIAIAKTIVSALKSMIGKNLGTSLEIGWEDMQTQPTSFQTPFICLFNNVEHYLTDGMALISAQARSIGIAMVSATSTIEALKRNNEKEAFSLVANTTNKIFIPINLQKPCVLIKEDYVIDFEPQTVDHFMAQQIKQEKLKTVRTIAVERV